MNAVSERLTKRTITFNMMIKFYFSLIFLVFFIGKQVSACDKNGEAGFKLINGIEMHYAIYGQGKPLVILHGNGEGMEDLKPLVKYYCSDYRVVIADSRGHGKTRLNTKHLTFNKIADDWAKLLKALNINKTSIVGLSDGGVVGLKLAVMNPNVVDKLVIFGTNVSPPEVSAKKWALEHESKFSDLIKKRIAEKDDSRDWVTLQQIHNLLFGDPNITAEDLQSIDSSVFVISSDKDVIRNDHTLYIFENLKKAHLAIIPGQTHLFPSHQPDQFNFMVKKFLDSEFHRPTTEQYFK